MGNLGPGELVIILMIALVVLGPKKLPDFGRSVGKALREFNKARNDFMETLNSEVYTDTSEHSTYDHDHYAAASSSTPAVTEYPATPGTVPVSGSYPPAPEDHSEALPYGGDFHAAEGDSQPSFRTAHPEPAPVHSAATMTAMQPATSAGVADGKA